MSWPALQCLTIDGIGRTHLEQVEALCAAGAEWIQLRMKHADDATVTTVAAQSRLICRAAGVRLILNDRIRIALEVGVDGVHLGRMDMDWAAARQLAGKNLIIGGTVNSVDDARRAVASQALDYVGVGPYRFTNTKQNLAPVLTAPQWRAILRELGDLPRYAIGGIRCEDLPQIQSLGCTGVAVSSALFAADTVARHYQRFCEAWAMGDGVHSMNHI